jgi:hypothetical protein
MKTWVRKTLSVGVLAAGALLFAPVAAHADVDQVADGNNGILNATQLVAPINIPVGVAGVGVGILGEGSGTGEVTNWGGWNTEDVTQASTDNNGVGNGTQAYLPVSIPVGIAGIGVGILGEGHGEGSVSNNTESAQTESVTQAATDNNGILNATQAYLPINIPVGLAGLGVGILGEGHGEGAVSNNTGGNSTESVAQGSSDNNGVANGTQVYAPIDIPIGIAGVGLGVLGEGTGMGSVSNNTGGGNSAEDATQVSTDNNGVGNGTQVIAPINAPVCVAGIGIGILGEGSGEGSCSNGGGDNETPGEEEPPAEEPEVPGTGDGDGYGEQSRKSARKAATQEALPTDTVTQGLNGQGLNLGGLDLLNTLR